MLRLWRDQRPRGPDEMGAAASAQRAAKKRREEKRLNWQMLILGDEWVPDDPTRPQDCPRLRQTHLITRRVLNPALKDIERQKKHKSAESKRKLSHMAKCTERVAEMMYADSAFLDHCFEVLGGYDSPDPMDPGRQKLCGERLMFLTLTDRGKEAAEAVSTGAEWLTRPIKPITTSKLEAWNAEIRLMVDERLTGDNVTDEWDDKSRRFVASGKWEDGAKWLKNPSSDVLRAVKFKWEVYVSFVGRGNLQACDMDIGQIEMDVQKGDGVVTLMVGWGGGMFAAGDKKVRWIIKPDRELERDAQHVLKKIVDIEVEVEDKWGLAGAYLGGTVAANGNPIQRTNGRGQVANDKPGSDQAAVFKGLWVRDVMLRTGWQVAAEKRERSKMARAEDDKNDLTGEGIDPTDPNTMQILKDTEQRIKKGVKERTNIAIAALKKEGLIQLIEFPILKCLPPSHNQIVNLSRELAPLDLAKLHKKARAPQASECVFNSQARLIECKYCVLDSGEMRQALDSDDPDFVRQLLLGAAVRYDKNDAEEDKYLTAEEVARWLTVLNYGDSPTELELDDVFSKVKRHRTSLGLSTGATDDRLLFREDFMLLTFDYYLAMTPGHMRDVFIDLLRT